MATTALTGVWIHEAANPTEYVTARLYRMTEAPEVEGRVVRYAGGRLVSVTTPGVSGTYQMTLRLVPRTLVAWITDRAGTLLMVRDTTGRLYYGVCLNPQIQESPVGDLDTVAEVTVTVRQVTYSPEV